MKNFLLIFIVISINNIYSQTTLSPGEIAIFGMNSDIDSDFGFVLLVDIETGTEIYFTDDGWSSGAFREEEGIVKFTASTNYSYGQIFTYLGDSPWFTDAGGAGTFEISEDGDQVIAYQGSVGSPTFIFALQSNSTQWQSGSNSDNQSDLPTGLTNGTNAIAYGSGSGAGDEYDNIAYHPSAPHSGTGAEILAGIADNSNWSGDNSSVFNLALESFTLSEPLPVELTNFEAVLVDNAVQLSWETATEVNNYGFEVQKSEFRSQNSEESWANVGFVQGHGTTNSPKQYSFTDFLDLNPNLTQASYRLKQIDIDGTFAYSKIVTIDLTTITGVEDEEIPIVYSLSQNYPNPFNPTTTIKFGLPESGLVDLTVYNILGQKVTQLINKQLQAGYHEVSFGGMNLPSGMYIYRISVGDKFTAVKKMLMIK